MINQTEKDKMKKFQLPHPYVLIIGIVIICAALTWLLPAGSFERAYDTEIGRELVVPGTYAEIEKTPVTPWQVVMSLYDGMVEGSSIIFFLLFACGYISLLVSTGAFNAAIGALLRKIKGKDHLLIPLCMFAIGVASTTFGLYEESWGLFPAFIAIAMTIGYDRVVGAAILAVGTVCGWSAGILNPFTVGLASSIAGIPSVSFKITLFRIISFLAFQVLSIAYVMKYAKKVKQDPTKSLMYGLEKENVNTVSRDEITQLGFKTTNKITILGFGLFVFVLAYTVSVKHFYLRELSALFFIAMVITGLINKMSLGEIADSFAESCKSMIFAALMVGFARSISVVLKNGNILDTIVLYLANVVQGLPRSVSGLGMLIIQNLINIFIPSGTGQAVVIMPIMAPVADLIGISREVAVLAYQFGEGFSNIFWPTCILALIGITGIPVDKWYKFVTPLFLRIFILQVILITLAIVLGV